MRLAGRSGPPEPVLFLDENLSGSKVLELLSAAGVQAISSLELLPRGAPDLDVIAAAAEHNLVIVTRDRDFRHHPSIAAAFRASKARAVFVIAKGSGRPEILAALLIKARRRIAAFVAEESAPALAKLGSSGKLTKVRLR